MYCNLGNNNALGYIEVEKEWILKACESCLKACEETKKLRIESMIKYHKNSEYLRIKDKLTKRKLFGLLGSRKPTEAQIEEEVAKYDPLKQPNLVNQKNTDFHNDILAIQKAAKNTEQLRMSIDVRIFNTLSFYIAK